MPGTRRRWRSSLGPRRTKEEKQRRFMVTYFKELGAKSVRFVERSLPFTEMVAIAESSEIIYLPDGDPKLLIASLARHRLDASAAPA